ncbi:hypothetical protein D047_1456B, partial [Vibrio parahaemolyticus VPTS-2010_2]
LAIITNSAL